MRTTTFDLYNLMERDNVLLAFKGTVTSDLLSSVFHIMETKMDDLNDSPATKKKVFNVLVECLQNLYHHIDDFDNDNTVYDDTIDKKSAIFSIMKEIHHSSFDEFNKIQLRSELLLLYTVYTRNFIWNNNWEVFFESKHSVETLKKWAKDLGNDIYRW